MYNIVRAKLHLLTAELPPEEAPDEWFLGADPVIDPVIITRVLFGINELLHRLDTEQETTDEAYQFHFYEAAKSAFGEDKKAIREFFKYLYLLLFGVDHGPRWGQFVAVTGVETFKKKLRESMTSL